MATDHEITIQSASASSIKRRQRIVDMMLSIHSTLRDRYASWATWLDLVILGGSIVLTATLLLDPRILVYLGVSDDGARLVLAVTSALVFFLSIVVLRVDWKQQSARHQQAAALLADLKARGRLAVDSPIAAMTEEYARLYDYAMAVCVPIPESAFLPLKAKHLRKIALSKAIDSHPNVPVWVLRLRLAWSDSKSVWTRTAVETRQDAG